MNFCCLREGNI